MSIKNIPKYQQLSDCLEEQIRKGLHLPKTKLPSERTLAKQYGMNHMTVNKAVTSLVEKGMLERLVGDGTYVKEVQKSVTAYSVGLVAQTNPEHHMLFENYFLPSLQKKGYFTVSFDVTDKASLNTQIPAFLKEIPKAIVIDGCDLFPFEILSKLNRHTKLIFINRYENHSHIEAPVKASKILVDYEHAGYIGINHLLALGKKRLAFISFDPAPGSLADFFLRGVKKAAKNAGIPLPLYIDDKKNHNYIEQLQRKKIDGILSFGDNRCLPLIKECRHKNIKMPDDIAVIGCFNTVWAEAYGITSISIRQKFIAEKAIKYIFEEEISESLIKPELVFRSTAPDVSPMQLKRK